MKKVVLSIDGMTCSACSNGLEKYLNKQEGIKQASINLIMNNANIEYDDEKLSLDQVEKFVEKAKKKYGDKYDYVTMTINHLLHFFFSHMPPFRMIL